MTLKLHPKKFFYRLLIFISFLLVCNILIIFIKLYNPDSFFRLIIHFFDFDRERNLPTFYSSLALLTCSLLLLLIAFYHKDKYRIQWKILGFIFLFLSIDEISVIHEQLSIPTQKLLDTHGLLYFAWYIPYGFLLLILVVVYAKWLFRLPKRIKFLFITSGVIFITGAIGFEAISSYYNELIGSNNIYYCLFYTLEELFEMLGVATFIYGLLFYISKNVKHIEVDIKTPDIY